MTGLLTIGTIGLGRLMVNGRKREPAPPAMTTAFIPGTPFKQLAVSIQRGLFCYCLVCETL